MDRHLVAVEVRVKRRADQGVQLYGLAFNQHRLEGLYAQAVQRGRPVQQHRVFPDHLFQDVPHLRTFPLHEFPRGLDGGRQPAPLQFAENEGFEQFQRHLLGQPALVQLQGRPHHNDGTPGIVHSLAEQVLAKTALLALDDVRQRFQRQLVAPGDGPAAAPVVQ